MSSIETMLRDIEMEVKLTERYLGKDRLDERVMAAMKQVPRQIVGWDQEQTPINSTSC